MSFAVLISSSRHIKSALNLLDFDTHTHSSETYDIVLVVEHSSKWLCGYSCLDKLLLIQELYWEIFNIILNFRCWPMLYCRTFLIRSSLQREAPLQHGVLFELPWAIQNLLICDMLLSGIRTAQTRIIMVNIS